jgi:hypothetical protein
MRLIQQAPYDWGCGYACLAMLTKLPIAEVLDRAGMADQPKDSKKLRLTYRRMFELLRDLRIEHTAQRRKWQVKNALPPTALVSVDAYMTHSTEWHWMVFHRERFFDPLTPHHLRWVRRRPRSYIEIEL